MKFFRRLFFLFAYHLYAKPKIARADRITMLGFSLIVEPSVFHPALYFSSRFLAEHISKLELNGAALLDMGTGSGIIGLCAARRGASVVALDINPVAVQCAHENAARNNFSKHICCRESDLFASLRGDERFDYIVWNPPFFPTVPKAHADHAWYAGEKFDVIQQFALELPAHLKDKGTVILILSTELDQEQALSFFYAEGFRATAIASRRRLFETLTIFHFTKR